MPTPAPTPEPTTPAAAPAIEEQPAPPLESPESNEAEFAAAFEEFSAKDDTVTEELPAAELPAEEPSEEAAPAAAAETAPDIWANATPEQKAAFEAAAHEVKSNRARASAQNRKIAELMKAQATPKAPEPAAEPAAETDEAWEEFKEEYPDVASAMEKRFGSQLAAVKAENASLKGQITGITDAQASAAISAEEAVLADRHPNWGQITATPEFLAWLPDQPKYVQDGFIRNGNTIVDGTEAASLIDLFVGGKPPAPAAPAAQPAPTPSNNGKDSRRERRLTSAVTTESGQAGPGSGPPEGDFDAAFEHYAKRSSP